MFKVAALKYNCQPGSALILKVKYCIKITNIFQLRLDLIKIKIINFQCLKFTIHECKIIITVQLHSLDIFMCFYTNISEHWEVLVMNLIYTSRPTNEIRPRLYSFSGWRKLRHVGNGKLNNAWSSGTIFSNSSLDMYGTLPHYKN